MILLTPTERMEWLKDQTKSGATRQKIGVLITRYEEFLDLTDATEKELVDRFLNGNLWNEYSKTARKFGDLMFEILGTIGKGNPFYRRFVV